MRRRGAWIGLAVVAVLGLLSPPAVAADQIGPPFLVTDGELACAAAGGFYGTPQMPVPRPPNASPTSSPVKCTSKHTVERGGLVTAALTAHGIGNATEGSFSSLFSYGYLRHRLKSGAKSAHYEVAVTIEDAFADVALQHQPTTTTYIALVLSATHPTCRACTATTFEIIADSDPRTETPDRIKGTKVNIAVDIDGGNGAAMPSGNVGLVFAVMPMVLTGTYASPVEALGSGTVRVRTTRIIADAS